MPAKLHASVLFMMYRLRCHRMSIFAGRWKSRDCGPLGGHWAMPATAWVLAHPVDVMLVMPCYTGSGLAENQIDSSLIVRVGCDARDRSVFGVCSVCLHNWDRWSMKVCLSLICKHAGRSRRYCTVKPGVATVLAHAFVNETGDFRFFDFFFLEQEPLSILTMFLSVTVMADSRH